MGRKSSIKQLPPDIKEVIDKAIREERATLDEICQVIDEMGGEVSRSALHRYRKKAEEQMTRWRDAQEVAKVWMGKIEETPDDEFGRMLSEMLKTLAYQSMATIGEADKVKPGDIQNLARSLKDLASADKLTAEKVLRIRKEEREKVADEITEAAEAQGMDADQAQFWREKVLGIK